MNKTQLATLVIVPTLCLAGMGALGYSNWQLRQEVAALKSGSLDKPSPASVLGSPNRSPNTPPNNPTPQSNDPFDNFFNGNWDPFADIQKMQQQMQQMMQQGGAQTFTFNAAQPDIDLQESKDAYVVNIKIPKGSDIELNTEVDDNQLVVSGKVSSKANKGGANIVSSSQFTRSFPLAKPVDSLGMTSETKDDTMIITLPKVG